MKIAVFLSLLGIVSLSITLLPNTDWPEYNGGPERNHYSPLTQITAENVQQLQVAWMYGSGGADSIANRTQIQCNPLIIKGVLYGVSANTQAFALDAATGKELWKTQLTDTEGTTSRGVAYWSDGQQPMIFFGAGQWLYALDARTGAWVKTFGDGGRINLKIGIERSTADEYVVVNTPVTIYKNLLIVGARLSESSRRCWVMYAPTTPARASWRGRFGRFLKKVNTGLILGRPTPAKTSAGPMPGQEWP
jgi:quinoprotein glucose dehydrogenase